MTQFNWNLLQQKWESIIYKQTHVVNETKNGSSFKARK